MIELLPRAFQLVTALAPELHQHRTASLTAGMALFQLPFAFGQNTLQVFFDGFQLAKLPANPRQLFFDERLDMRAGPYASIPQNQQLADFIEREPKLLRLTYEVELLDNLRRKDAVAGICAGRLS
jgi:hypothetical protein